MKDYSMKNEFNDLNSFLEFINDTGEDKGIKAVFHFDIDSQDIVEEFNEICKVLYHRKNCTIVIEEVQHYAPLHKIPKYLREIILTGRHNNLSLITTTQRIAEIHKTVLSQSDHIFAGFSDMPNDLKTLKEYGFNSNLIEHLPDFEFIWKYRRDYFLSDNKLNLKKKL